MIYLPTLITQIRTLEIQVLALKLQLKRTAILLSDLELKKKNKGSLNVTNEWQIDNSMEAIFKQIHANPSLLKQSVPEISAKLQSQAKENTQGTGNKVTEQEASFASILESNKIQFQPKNAPLPTVPGSYYLYQLNGSQKSIDFRVFTTDGKTMLSKVDLDLKHTGSDVFFLNDGWFHKDVVYIVTWARRTSAPRKRLQSEVATFIGLGQDIPTAEETALMTELQKIKKTCNTDFKGAGSLCTFVRFANRYKCERFTPDFTELCFGKVKEFLHSSSSPSSSSLSVV